jgi:hypothetical protein
MTNGTEHGVRRYSDLLTTGCIKTGPDGRKIVYPWGKHGNGYIIPSNDAYERLNDLLKIYVVVGIWLLLPITIPGQYAFAAIVMALWLALYWIWMRFELRGLERTQERLTFREGFTNIARLMPGWLLWVEAILTLVFVAAGALMLIIEPAKWMIALAGIVFFGLGTVMSVAMLVMQRRLARGQS